MFAFRRIRSKLYIGVAALVVVILMSTTASVIGARKFRKLTKSIRERSMELPAAAELGQRVSELRSMLSQMNHPVPYAVGSIGKIDFLDLLAKVKIALLDYEVQLGNCRTVDPDVAEGTKELDFVNQFQIRLNQIDTILNEESLDRVFRQGRMYDPLETPLGELQELAAQLPVSMQQRMDGFAERAQSGYLVWMWVAIGFTALVFLLVGFLIYSFLTRIMKPLEKMVDGSREVADGNYDHRIDLKLKPDDEVAELAGALNSMTANFQSIQNDLNLKVRQRTKEVVKSEKMASVGFLAFGVAHEINNPMATIAWSAESLESRIYDILDPEQPRDTEHARTEIADMQKYLRRIQSEAFRIKDITDSLLDFARVGDAQRKSSSLPEIVELVISMVKPLGKYRRRNISFHTDGAVRTVVNEQEMKQVILNLVTNALDSVEENGTVDISLRSHGENATLTIKDDGCGMDEETKQQLFEPFFTRKRHGQGTGLGLSITYQIIEEHGGKIDAHSDGKGTGSTFTVTLPLVNHEQAIAKSA